MTKKIRLNEAARKVAVEMLGEDGPERMEATYTKRAVEVDTSWAEISSGWVLNGMYARQVLPTATRELCAVAALTVLGHRGELRGHLAIGLRLNPPETVREVILQMAVYAGMPPTFEALRIYDSIVGEPDFTPRVRRPLTRAAPSHRADAAPATPAGVHPLPVVPRAQESRRLDAKT